MKTFGNFNNLEEETKSAKYKNGGINKNNIKKRNNDYSNKKINYSNKKNMNIVKDIERNNIFKLPNKTHKRSITPINNKGKKYFN